MDFFRKFDAGKCTLCGECFHRCPVMHLPLDMAKDEIKKLIEGRETKWVLQKCTSCFACNFICPEGCNPAQKILDVWHEKSVRQGLPVRAMYFIPDSPLNFRTYVLDRLPQDERELVKSWEDASPCEEIFYPGCNWITVPYLTRTSLLKGVNIRGSLNLCCGETYYRTGQYEMVERSARRLQDWHSKVRFKKMIIPCTAGRNMFTNVLPKFGVKFDFEVQHMLPWLLSRIENGEIRIANPLNMKLTIQESCYGKFFGDEYMDVPRRLLKEMGATVVEEDLCRQNALCCGIGGGFSYQSSYHPWDITLATVRSLRLAGKTGAQALVVYCAGCLQMLTVGQIVYPNRMPVYHIVELLQMAIGEQPERKHKQRGRTMFKGVVLNQFPKTLSRKKFSIQNLP
jgi:Fe-S oxidoreductase